MELLTFSDSCILKCLLSADQNEEYQILLFSFLNYRHASRLRQNLNENGCSSYPYRAEQNEPLGQSFNGRFKICGKIFVCLMFN